MTKITINPTNDNEMDTYCKIIYQGDSKNILAGKFPKINKLCSMFIRGTRVV